MLVEGERERRRRHRLARRRLVALGSARLGRRRAARRQLRRHVARRREQQALRVQLERERLGRRVVRARRVGWRRQHRVELPRRRGGLAVDLVELGGKAPALKGERARRPLEAILEARRLQRGAQLANARAERSSSATAVGAGSTTAPALSGARGAALGRAWWRWPRAPAAARAAGLGRRALASARRLGGGVLVAFAVLDGLYGIVGSWFCLARALLHAAGGTLWLVGFAAGCRSGFGHLASGLHIAMISGMPITASASWILAGVNFIDRRRRARRRDARERRARGHTPTDFACACALRPCSKSSI